MASAQWIDTHVHLVDFLQHPAAVTDLRDSLVGAGVQRAVPLPLG
jgi:hypothetical protein